MNEGVVGAALAATNSSADGTGSRRAPLLQKNEGVVGADLAATNSSVDGTGSRRAPLLQKNEGSPEPPPVLPTASQSENAPPLLENETWILAQNPDHYTIQAIGLRNRETLVALVEGHDDLAPLAIYTVQKTSNPIHVLVQGVYPTVEEARAARDRFPRAINRPDRVWIRQFGKVQAIIEAER